MAEARVKVWVQRFKDRHNLQLQWYDPITGKRETRTAGTADRDEAERARADLEYELNHGRFLEASRMTWGIFRELFEDEYVSGLRENTQAVFTATLNKFENLCRPGRLRAIDERTISRFVAAMRKEPGRSGARTAASTIKVRLQFLHTALSWAVDQKLLPAVPRFPTVKVPKKDPQPVPPESFEKLLLEAQGDAPMRAYLLTGWLAGLRLTEALRLEREPSEVAPYLDLGRDRIVLPAEFVKADRDQWVPLDPELRTALEGLPAHGRRVFRFVTGQGRPLSASGLSQRIVQLARRAGVKLTMRSLRRGFGCRYAGTASAHVLQRLMRHASLKTTMDYYANVDAAVEEAVLGSRRNRMRNSGDPGSADAAPEKDVSG
jgi:integrase